MTATKRHRKHPKPPTRSALARPAGSALLSDLAELTLLACTIRHNAREMRNALDCMDRIADMLEANRARLKAQNASDEPR
jgi:hypothetical protein